MVRSISLTPIAIVRGQFDTNTPADEMRLHPSQLVVEPKFMPGLRGLNPGREILVLFYLHRIRPDEIHLELHPHHNPDNPLTGVFSTRTQFRPNQIGLSVAKIEAISDNIISVSGLDAQDGSPVFDIKPYTPYFDADIRSRQFEVRTIDSLQEARDAIDLIDREVIRLLGNRAGYVHQVVNFKQRAEDVPAPARYAEVMRQRRTLAEEAGLNPDVVEGMYKLLVDNFIEEELELIRQREARSA